MLERRIAMSERLEVSTESTSQLDLLADLLEATRLATRYSRDTYVGRWGMSFGHEPLRGFHIVERGEVWLRVGEGAPLRLQVNDVLLVNTPHALLSHHDAPCVPFSPTITFPEPDPSLPSATLICGAYELEDAEEHPIFSQLPPLIHLRAAEHDPHLANLIALLQAELALALPGERAIARHLVDALLFSILRCWIVTSCPQQLGWLRALGEPLLSRTLSLIHRDPRHPWTIASLARHAGTSRATLARRFTEVVGLSPIHYLTEHRLMRARRLLSSTSRSLDEIAAEVGYASSFSLSKAYKRKFSVSPSAHRA